MVQIHVLKNALYDQFTIRASRYYTSKLGTYRHDDNSGVNAILLGNF